MIMDLTKLIFKREQLRLALANVTECLNDTCRFNYGCEGNCTGTHSGCCETCEAMCAGGCHNACTDECTGDCSGSCDGVTED